MQLNYLFFTTTSCSNKQANIQSTECKFTEIEKRCGIFFLGLIIKGYMKMVQWPLLFAHVELAVVNFSLFSAV
jgi:hypothetical protein